MQEFEFVDNRRALRAIPILLILVCLLAAYVVISGTRQNHDTGGPDIRLPKIGALPRERAPNAPVVIARDRDTPEPRAIPLSAAR